jgi:hypothetical protein
VTSTNDVGVARISIRRGATRFPAEADNSPASESLHANLKTFKTNFIERPMVIRTEDIYK